MMMSRQLVDLIKRVDWNQVIQDRQEDIGRVIGKEELDYLLSDIKQGRPDFEKMEDSRQKMSLGGAKLYAEPGIQKHVDLSLAALVQSWVHLVQPEIELAALLSYPKLVALVEEAYMCGLVAGIFAGRQIDRMLRDSTDNQVGDRR